MLKCGSDNAWYVVASQLQRLSSVVDCEKMTNGEVLGYQVSGTLQQYEREGHFKKCGVSWLTDLEI